MSACYSNVFGNNNRPTIIDTVLFQVLSLYSLRLSTKRKILNNLAIIKDFFWVTSGTRTHDIQNHNLTL